MIAIMYDGLELGTFHNENGKLVLKLNDNIHKQWLPYIFELGLDNGTDMNEVIAAWKKERVFPKNRLNSRKLLKELGLKKYDIDKIAEITSCSVVTDPYWLVYKDTDRYHTESIRGQLGESHYPYNSIGVRDEDKYIWRK